MVESPPDGGNVNDIAELAAVRAGSGSGSDPTGRLRMRPDRVIGDKGYNSWSNRAMLARRGSKVTIAERND